VALRLLKNDDQIAGGRVRVHPAVLLTNDCSARGVEANFTGPTLRA
jgi:hypothetical protein